MSPSTPRCGEQAALAFKTRSRRPGHASTVFTTEPFCFRVDDDLPLSNDYGWGYPGEPWNAGEDYECECGRVLDRRRGNSCGAQRVDDAPRGRCWVVLNQAALGDR